MLRTGSGGRNESLRSRAGLWRGQPERLKVLSLTGEARPRWRQRMSGQLPWLGRGHRSSRSQQPAKAWCPKSTWKTCPSGARPHRPVGREEDSSVAFCLSLSSQCVSQTLVGIGASFPYKASEGKTNPTDTTFAACLHRSAPRKERRPLPLC